MQDVDFTPDLIDRFAREVLALGMSAISPVSLSDEWLERLTVEADGYFTGKNSAPCLTLATLWRSTMPASTSLQLNNRVKKYAVSVYAEREKRVLSGVFCPPKKALPLTLAAD